MKLTKKMVDSFTYKGGWDVRWDTAIPGFGVRLYPGGKKTYVLSYRNKGRKRLMKIEQCNKITLDQARAKARRHLGELADKVDPLEKKKIENPKRSVESVFRDYLNKYAKPKNRSWRETERIFKADVLPAIGKKQIHEIAKKDIIKIVDKVANRGSKVMANRTLAHLRKFFNWCHARDLIETLPVLNVAKPAPEISRDRVLSDEEIKYVWQACDKEGFPFGDFLKMTLVTGQRKSEVLNMRWQDIDTNRKLWTLPKESTKSNREHYVHLSPLALRILENAEKQDEYVFSIDGKKPFNGFSKAKSRVETLIGELREKENKKPMPEWRIHDLRRTAASDMAGLKVPPYVIERVLNHSSGIISGVAAVYNRYEYADETREALDKWAGYVEKLTGGSGQLSDKKVRIT